MGIPATKAWVLYQRCSRRANIRGHSKAALESCTMVPEELRDILRQQPFQPFRLVMTDGAGYDIRHQDLLWIGQRSAMVGMVGQAGLTFYERAVRVDLSHVIRIEPLETLPAAPTEQTNAAAEVTRHSGRGFGLGQPPRL